MKKILFFLLSFLFVSGGMKSVSAQTGMVTLDAGRFPDGTFRASLSGYDVDKDGCLSEQEINSITRLYYDGGDNKYWREIESFKGIEYFTELEEFTVMHIPKVSELDLSYNKKLNNLQLVNTPLNKINLKNCANLTYFYGVSLKISSLDLTGCERLESFVIDCTPVPIASNGVEKINVLKMGNKPYLKKLHCINSSMKKKINIKNMPVLEQLKIIDNKYSNLDISGLKKLSYLYLSGDSLKSLTLCKNKNLKVTLTKNTKLKMGWKNTKKNVILKSSDKNIISTGKNRTVTASKKGKAKLSDGKNKCFIEVIKK